MYDVSHLNSFIVSKARTKEGDPPNLGLLGNTTTTLFYR